MNYRTAGSERRRSNTPRRRHFKFGLAAFCKSKRYIESNIIVSFYFFFLFFFTYRLRLGFPTSNRSRCVLVSVRRQCVWRFVFFVGEGVHILTRRMDDWNVLKRGSEGGIFLNVIECYSLVAVCRQQHHHRKQEHALVEEFICVSHLWQRLLWDTEVSTHSRFRLHRLHVTPIAFT